MDRMRIRWRGRWRLRRAATALVALTLLPVAVLVGSAHARAGALPPLAPWLHTDSLQPQDIDLPVAEALKRSEASNLFAPFGWDGQIVSGPFVEFDYSPATGEIVGYFAVNGTSTTLLVNKIRVADFSPTSTPLVSGPTFVASGSGVSLVVHDEPMALLEIRSQGQARTVVLRFPTGTTEMQVVYATDWPRSSLAFTVGATHGRLILGRGSLTVNGTTATAQLETEDYLALRAVPGFVEHASERTAVLEAFASGRLAAEYDLIAMSNGGWLENSAQYQIGLTATSSHVEFSRATVTFGVMEPRAGLVLLAFDPQTMPADPRHRLVVTESGVDVPEAANPVESLYSLPGSSSHASFTRLAMNATVLVVYLSDLSATPLQVESIALPTSGLDWPTELAMVAAAFVVSVAAAVMFRRPHE